jgi:putative ABC transport system ATP-binding protein
VIAVKDRPRTYRDVEEAIHVDIPTSPPMIRVRDITKTYRMGEVDVHALRGVSLEIEKGEFVSIMGPSGSGKSTLMNVLGCLDAPSEGTYLLNGQDVSRLRGRELARIRNREIGFVFQTFNLLARTPAQRQVELPLVYAGVNSRERRRMAGEALETVGLGSRMKHKPEELSGGERQRVAIARALATNPSIILADEPTGNLDSRTGHEILRLFQELNESGISIIFVTHDSETAEYSHRIIHIRDGLLERDETN